MAIGQGQLRVFQRQHSNGTPCNSFVLASWHWKWSLTWRWVFVWSQWYRPPGRQGFSSHRNHIGRGFNFMAVLNLPLIGHFLPPDATEHEDDAERGVEGCDAASSRRVPSNVGYLKNI